MSFASKMNESALNESASNILKDANSLDADLLDAWIKDRHAASLAVLIQRYSVMVLSVCRRRCRTESDADDAYQSTFLHLARNAAKIRNPERLPGWLHRVAQRASVATLQNQTQATDAMIDTPADPSDPLDRLTQRHESIVLDEELSELPEHYRTVLVMHIFDDLSLATLAEKLETTVGSIRGRLQRAKKLLASRLRRRGVVPVMAFASASAWTVTASTATQASELLIRATADGSLPSPPIEPSLLDNLLNQGANAMSSLYTVAGLVGGAALLAFVLTINDTNAGNGEGGDVVTFPASIAKTDGANAILAKKNNNQTNAKKRNNKKKRNGNADKNVANNVAAQFGGAPAQADKPQTNRGNQVAPKPTEPKTEIAKQIIQAMDKPGDYDIPSTTLQSLLVADLPEQVGFPFMIDQRAIEFAEADISKPTVPFKRTAIPLRTALREVLQPHGLKADVEDEGIVITADFGVLVHKDIGVSKWINVDEEDTTKIIAGLNEVVAIKDELQEAPLEDAIQIISEQLDIRVLIDRVALEETGLTVDTPVDLSPSVTTYENVLREMITPLDLTLSIQGNSLLITTLDGSDENLLQRIYWLESTGFPRGDYDTVMNVVQTTVAPDGWVSVGGMFTIQPLATKRPAVIVAANFDVHQNLDSLFKSMRLSHMGNDPLSHVDWTQQAFGGGGFGGGGGGLGGGMGGSEMGGGGFF